MKTQTKLIHTKGSPDPLSKAMVTPITLSTVFAMETPSSHAGFQYGRIGNPTRQQLESTMADLEGASFAAVVSSGSAASTTLLATLRSGDRLLCTNQIYEGTERIFRMFEKFGITIEFVDFTNDQRILEALTMKPKLVWFETPTNPWLTLLDISRISALAHKVDALVVVDNTLATPILQKPIHLGADVVIESLTKGLNGHSDVVAGAIATNNEALFHEIRFFQQALGTPLSPFDCFLVLRGLKTAPLRIKEQQKNARIIAAFLSEHSSITRVHFPDSPDQKKLRAKQMKGPGTLVSFTLKENHINPKGFLMRLKLVTIGHSLGGPETLILQPTTMMDLSKLNFEALKNNFFRLSVGLEDVQDILTDIRNALDPASKI